MSVIALPKILREKLTDEGAEALVELLNKTGTKSEEAMLDRRQKDLKDALHN